LKTRHAIIVAVVAAGAGLTAGCAAAPEWENTEFFHQQFGPSGPAGPPSVTPMRLHEHFVRAGIAIR
jgi:hypothetical protein